MPGVEPGDYVVVAREGGRALGIATVMVEPEAEASVELVLSDGGFVTGRIVDEAGRPLAGRVRVEVFEDRGLPSLASDLMAGDSKTDGLFALGPLPLGTLGLGVTAPQRASRRVEASLPARGRTVDLGEVVLEAGLAIRGRVADREGSGIGGASLRAQGLAGERARGEATADAEGAFVVGGLKAGSYEIRATAPGYATAVAKTEPGADPLELVMVAGGQIAGTVVDTMGQPVEDARIRPGRRTRSPSTPTGFFFGSAEEGGGRFVLQDILAGTYDLEAQATGTAPPPSPTCG